MRELDAAVVAGGAEQIAHAITPLNATIGDCPSGGKVGSLTEAVMGVSGGLCRIAEAINSLADAVRESDIN